MKITFITTFLNEEKSIGSFIKSLSQQTRKPDEIILVDGGSTDATLKIIQSSKLKFKNYNSNFKVSKKMGNRSEGRNYAIKHATGDVIAVSDVGCILDKNWLKNIVLPFENKNVDVTSGFYKPVQHSIFEKCLATYTCVMPDKVNPNNFLPSSRSVAFKKSAWEKVGGYPEGLDTCEDLVFDKKLRQVGFNFVFQRAAFVHWPQRENVIEAANQFFSYSKGDGHALYIRPNTPFLFARYIVGLFLLFVSLQTKSYLILNTLYFILLLYILWSVFKNYRYVNHPAALLYLPLLQFTSDVTVILGFLVGLTRRLIWGIKA